MCRKVWGFESLRGHQVIRKPVDSSTGFFFLSADFPIDQHAFVLFGETFFHPCRELVWTQAVIFFERLMNPGISG